MKIENVEIELNGKPFALGVDTFDGTDWLYDEVFETNEEAIAFAKSKGGQMLKVHAYDKNGKHIGDGGTF